MPELQPSLKLANYSRSPDEVRPFLHQHPPPLEQVGPAISGLHLIAIHVRQGELAVLAGRVGALGRPVPERGPEPVRYGLDPEIPEQPGDRVVTECAAVGRREDPARSAREFPRFVQDFKHACRQRHPVIAFGLHAARGDRPCLQSEVHFVPCGEPDLTGPAGRQHQELERQRQCS